MSAVLSGSIKFEFLPMNSCDLDAVLAIEQRVYAFPWTRGNFVDSLASGYSAWLMCDGDKLLGYAVMLLVLDEAHLLNISIAPERQHAGFGSLLLEHLFAVARKHGAVKMFLEVRSSNFFACEFYGRQGFFQIGARPGYYPARNGREEAILMERTL